MTEICVVGVRGGVGGRLSGAAAVELDAGAPGTYPRDSLDSPSFCQGGLCNLLIYCRVHADVDVMAQGSQCKRISVYCVRVHVCLACSRTLTSLRTRPPF